jgi:hypothetical protein
MSDDLPISDEEKFHRTMAVRFFNETWTLLDKQNRTAEEDARMVHLAHASRLHWEFVGSATNLAIGEWQISRVHAVLHQADSALFHAERSLVIAQVNSLEPFHVAYAHEAIARALSITKSAAVLTHLHLARTLAAQISDPEEKKLVEDDLETVVSPS